MKKDASKQKRRARSTAQKKTKSSKTFDPEQQQQTVEEKAYELYENRGYEHGNDQDDWYEAENIISSGGARVEQ